MDVCISLLVSFLSILLTACLMSGSWLILCFRLNVFKVPIDNDLQRVKDRDGYIFIKITSTEAFRISQLNLIVSSPPKTRSLNLVDGNSFFFSQNIYNQVFACLCNSTGGYLTEFYISETRRRFNLRFLVINPSTTGQG
jgi:hypothetical protein